MHQVPFSFLSLHRLKEQQREPVEKVLNARMLSLHVCATFAFSWQFGAQQSVRRSVTEAELHPENM